MATSPRRCASPAAEAANKNIRLSPRCRGAQSAIRGSSGSTLSSQKKARSFQLLVSVSSLCALLLFAADGFGRVKLPHTSIHPMVLQNGLRVLMVEDHQAPVVNTEVWYYVGSKDEKPGRTGFAHLFEHLMFDGTRNLGPDEFSSYIVRSGGTDNAYTTEDATVFWETFPSTELPVALWLEADRMRNLDISDSTFKNERKVVEEERRQRFDNQPYGSVIETLYAHAFTVHPYQHMTIGSMDDLDHAKLDEVRDFYDTYYVPDNATLVIIGDFDTAQSEQWVKQYFGPVPNTGRPISRDYPVEPPQTAAHKIKLNLDVALPAVVEGFHMPADGTPDAYPLRLASKILGDGDSSWINRLLVYKTQIALEADSSGNFTEDPNLFFVLAVLNSGHTPAQAEALMDGLLSRLKNQPVPAKDLDRAKNQILRDFILSRQGVQNRADELGYDAVILKNPDLINTELARFLAVTAEDIQRVAQKYFVASNLTEIEVYPAKTK
ncbi:MAG TPA: pitrilysin family protein [Terriglobia bacterium]|nr:pitrilysin family protein [Terriglobia bacterium]